MIVSSRPKTARTAQYALLVFYMLFLAFPLLLPRLGFWLTMLASAGVTVVCFGLFALLVRQFGIQLLP